MSTNVDENNFRLDSVLKSDSDSVALMYNESQIPRVKSSVKIVYICFRLYIYTDLFYILLNSKV